MKYPKSVIEMQNELGEPYEIKNIDGEPCLYRNFKNGFDLEISGVYSRRRKENRRIFIKKRRNTPSFSYGDIRRNIV